MALIGLGQYRIRSTEISCLPAGTPQVRKGDRFTVEQPSTGGDEGESQTQGQRHLPPRQSVPQMAQGQRVVADQGAIAQRSGGQSHAQNRWPQSRQRGAHIDPADAGQLAVQQAQDQIKHGHGGQRNQPSAQPAPVRTPACPQKTGIAHGSGVPVSC